VDPASTSQQLVAAPSESPLFIELSAATPISIDWHSELNGLLVPGYGAWAIEACGGCQDGEPTDCSIAGPSSSEHVWLRATFAPGQRFEMLNATLSFGPATSN